MQHPSEHGKESMTNFAAFSKILAEKQEGKLSELTERELQKRINALDV